MKNENMAESVFCHCIQQHGDDAQGCGPPLKVSTTFGPRTKRSHAHCVVFCFSFLVINCSLLIAVTVLSEVAKYGEGAIGFIRLKALTIGKLITHR